MRRRGAGAARGAPAPGRGDEVGELLPTLPYRTPAALAE